MSKILRDDAGASGPRRLCAALTLALASFGHARPASAGAFEVIGVGPRGIAEAGALTARATDGSAAFFNPAGLAMGRGVHVDIAPQLAGSTLGVQGTTPELVDPFGFVLLADATLPFTGVLADRFRVGIALHVPTSGAIHLLVAPPGEPQFPYFANRTQRLVVEPALAIRVVPWLAVGAGINLLGGVAGPADVRPGASGVPEPRIAIDATRQLALQAGVRVELDEHIHLGATYRQQFSVPVLVTTQAEIGGIGLTADIDLQHALFDPHTVVLGAAFDVDRLEVELDVAYSVWSAYDGPGLAIRAELPGALLTSEEQPRVFRDVVTVRAAGSYGFDVGRSSELVLHAGTGFEPTFLTGASQGTANLADGSKIFGGLGVSFALRGVLPKTLRFAAGLGGTFVLPQTVEKLACSATPCAPGTVVGPDPDRPSEGIQNPGYPRLTSGGTLLTGSLGVGVDL